MHAPARRAFPQLPAAIALALTFLAPPAARAAIDWRPVEPDDLAATSSTIDPDANAEVLYNLVEIDDKAQSTTTYRYYQRIKIFNEKGVQEFDKIDIPYSDKARLRHVSARIIMPGGEIIPIGKKDFHTRDVFRSGKQKVQVTSFSFPKLTPGAIIEWQSESRTKECPYAHRILMQTSMPVRHFRLRYRPFPNPYARVQTVFIHCPTLESEKGKDDYITYEHHDLPPLKTEPLMPPIDDVQQWMILYAQTPGNTPKFALNRFMNSFGEALDEYIKPPKKNDPVKAKSAELVEGAQTPEEKLARIHDFCRANIRNTSLESSGFTPAEIEKLKPNKTVADVLARTYGDRFEITALFIALARAAGFDAYLALCHDRSEHRYNEKLLAVSIPTDIMAAVSLMKTSDAVKHASHATERTQGELKGLKVGTRTLSYYAPGSKYLPAEKLAWYNQNTAAYVQSAPSSLAPRSKQTDARAIGNRYTHGIRLTPISPASENISRRTATLRLDEEGTLEGDIRMAPEGQQQYEAKIRYAGETVEAREKLIRDDVISRLPGAEVTDIKVHNADSPLAPLFITCHIRVPNYADLTGQRLFVQPGFFKKNVPSVFTAAERTHDINLEYPWSEEDEITIAMPAGFVIEAGSSPASIKGNENFIYDASILVNRSKHGLVYKRKLLFGSSDLSKDKYTPIKKLFDAIHRQDNHIITLKRDESAGAIVAADSASQK